MLDSLTMQVLDLSTHNLLSSVNCQEDLKTQLAESENLRMSLSSEVVELEEV